MIAQIGMHTTSCEQTVVKLNVGSAGKSNIRCAARHVNYLIVYPPQGVPPATAKG